MTKTALNLTAEELKKYNPYTNLAKAKHNLKNKHHWQQAWHLAYTAAKILKQQFGAKQVIVFGSLIHQAWFNAWSDIDLAIWGISPNKFYKAVGMVAEIDPDFKIDVVDIQTCQPRLKQRIEEEGIEIWLSDMTV